MSLLPLKFPQVEKKKKDTHPGRGFLGLTPKVKILLSILATAAGVVLIVLFVPFKDIAKALEEISPRALIIGFSLYALSYVFRTLRWKIYYSEAPFGYLFLTTAVNTFLNNTVPMRLGELSVFGFLRRFDPDVKTTLKKFLKVRLYDAIALLTVLTFAVVSLKTNYLFGLLSAVAVYPAVLLLSKFFYGLWKKFPVLDAEPLTFLYSLGALLSKLLAVYAVLEFLPLGFVKFTVGFLGGEISSILPVNAFANIGTYESAFSLALKFFTGESFKEGVKVAFLSHAFLLFASAILGGFSLLYLLRKFPRRG